MSRRQPLPLSALAGSRRTEHQRPKSFPAHRRPRVHAPITGSDGSWRALSGGDRRCRTPALRSATSGVALGVPEPLIEVGGGDGLRSGHGVGGTRGASGDRVRGDGTMGAPMARHLVAAGHDVRVFDRSPSAMAAVDGRDAVRVGAPRPPPARRACSCRCPGRPTSRRRSIGADGVLAAEPRTGRSSSISRRTRRRSCRRLHERCAAAGVGFVDAPVSGGRVKAESGELSVMAGGDDADVAAVEPLLAGVRRRRCSTSARPVPAPSPSSSTTSCSSPPSVLVQEAYVLGAAAGLDPADAAPHRARQLRRSVRGAGAAAARP